MIFFAQILVVIFGLFLIAVGLLLLLAPNRAWKVINKAASTPRIHFGELTMRMIPAAGLVIYAPHSKFPEFLQILGWFMIGTSILLMFMPRAWHYAYAQKCVAILPPYLIRLLAPLSFAFGGFILYSIL